MVRELIEYVDGAPARAGHLAAHWRLRARLRHRAGHSVCQTCISGGAQGSCSRAACGFAAREWRLPLAEGARKVSLPSVAADEDVPP